MGRKPKDPQNRRGGNKWKKQQVKVICPSCDNGGRFNPSKCTLCNGTGHIMALK